MLNLSEHFIVFLMLLLSVSCMSLLNQLQYKNETYFPSSKPGIVEKSSSIETNVSRNVHRTGHL